jgi:hypothetical protein
MIEALTDEERAGWYWLSGATKAKAIRIIDAHAAERAALVAVIERVRAAKQWHEIDEALAGAGALEVDPDAGGVADINTRLELSRKLDAALARVKELEDELVGREARYVAAQEQRNEANARAEAATSNADRWSAACDDWKAKCEAAEQRVADLESVDERGLLGSRISDLESEAASLRIELECWRTLFVSPEANAATINALRAEVERLTATSREGWGKAGWNAGGEELALTRLAAATELLGCAKRNLNVLTIQGKGCERDIERLLANATAAPTRTECKYVGRCNSSRCEACNPPTRTDESGAPGHTLCDYDDCDQEPTVTLPRGAVMCEHHAAVALLAGMSSEEATSTFRFARPVPETTRTDHERAVLERARELDLEWLRSCNL